MQCVVVVSLISVVLGIPGLPADPPCRTAGDKPTHGKLPHGVVSVEAFGADATGATDSTKSFQSAFEKARTDNITLFVPLGCYTITDSIVGMEPRNGRWQPIQVIGQSSDWKGRRPTLVLPPATSGFTDAYKPMMSFWTNWCLAPGPEPSLYYNDSSLCRETQSDSRSPWLFNIVVQGLDFVIGQGNFGAVGLEMIGAQGSTLQDVTVYAGPDALAGVAGGNGGGGVFVGVTVIGGRFGVDARKTSCSATFTSMRLINQSCAAMVVGPGTRSTNAIIGLHVEGSPSLGGVLSGINLPSAGSTCFAAKSTRLEHGSDPLGDAVSLIDASFKLSGSGPCVKVDASLWMQNVFANGCADVVVSGGKPLVSNTSLSVHVRELALGRQESAGNYSFPMVSDGSRSEGIYADLGDETTSEDFFAKHHWGDAAADFQSHGAVDALELGAKGDGLTDDWPALQSALDKHDIVVLPKGLYRLSRPLVMHREGAALIGVGAARSFLMPLSRGFSPQEQPVLEMSAEGATVKGLTVVTWSHLATGYAIRWSGDGIYRQAFVTREPESVFQVFPQGVAPDYVAPVSFNRPLVVVSGGGAFYDFDLDFGCCFGHINPPGESIGPGFASNDEVLLQRPGFRTLLINGSVSGLRFYPHNTEQAFSDAYTEVSRSFNVTLYNTKSENNYAILWIRDSDLITVHGFGGAFIPFTNTTDYNDGSDIRNSVLGISNLSANWADLGAGCCVTKTPPVFDGELAETGVAACQKHCEENFEDCGYISSGHAGARSHCTIWPLSASCSVDAGGQGHCGSRGDDGVHSFARTGGYTPFMPSSVRVQRSTRITLANVLGFDHSGSRPTKFISGGKDFPADSCNVILYQDMEGVCDASVDPQNCHASEPFDRPVLWRWNGAKMDDILV